MTVQNSKLLFVCISLLLTACGKSPESTARVDGAVPPVVATSSVVAAKRSMPELAIKHNCVYCHDIDKKRVGPAWADVAKRYKGETEYIYYGEKYSLAEGLRTKISKGGTGVWGQMPMPANDPSGVKRDDIDQLIRFILSLDQ